MTTGTSRLFDLLRVLGREEDEVVPILSEVPGEKGMHTTWCRVEKADATVDALDGHNLWFGVQPLTRPEVGRGRAADVSGICCLYVDIDFLYPHKPDGSTREQAGQMIEALSEILGVGPAAVVRSGGGLHPYWPITRTDAMAGAVILAWWREQVIHVAQDLSMKVDTGVYDLPRILRVPGPPNLKTDREGTLLYGPEGGPTALVVLGGGRRLAPGELQRIIAAHPTSGRTRVTPDGLVVATRTAGSDDRVFFDPEEAMRYLRRPDGALAIMGATPEGAGFNDALNAAAFEVAAFVPEFLGAQEAWDLVIEELERIFPGGPDSNDAATIRSGFGQTVWSARTPRADEAGNPFSNDPSEAAKCRAAWERGGRKVGRPGAGGGVRRQDGDDDSEHSGRGGSEGGNGDVDPGEGFLPEWFWEARPIFGHLRRAAWAGMESPEGVLVAGLALTLAHVMPNVKLPACIGTEASLNLMTILTGDPGDGKSVCRKIAARALQFNEPDLWEFNPSSGQGVSGQFQYLKKTRGQPAEMIRSRFRALAVVEESDTIAALAKNDTSTLSSELRKAAMGERLGFGNIGETQTNLAEHEYRFVLMMCLQPQLGGWLLGDDAGGLPQRFLWCSVRDPRIVDGVERPGIFTVTLPLEALRNPMSDEGHPRAERVMGITGAICEEIREARRERKRSGRAAGADFDGHSVLTRLKVAGGLALMAGRLDIGDDDWALALVIMVMSGEARGLVQRAVAERAARETQQRGLARGRARVVEETVVGEVADAKARKQVTALTVARLKRAGEVGVIKSELRGKLHSDLRPVFDEGVLDALLDLGQVRFEDLVKDGKQVGSRWFWVE